MPRFSDECVTASRMSSSKPRRIFGPRDLLVLVGDQHVPVEMPFGDGPAEAGGILEILAKMAGIDEQLLWNAAADHAGAAEAVFLGDGDARAGLCRQPARPHAARP